MRMHDSSPRRAEADVQRVRYLERMTIIEPPACRAVPQKALREQVVELARLTRHEAHGVTHDVLIDHEGAHRVQVVSGGIAVGESVRVF